MHDRKEEEENDEFWMLFRLAFWVNSTDRSSILFDRSPKILPQTFRFSLCASGNDDNSLAVDGYIIAACVWISSNHHTACAYAFAVINYRSSSAFNWLIKLPSTASQHQSRRVNRFDSEVNRKTFGSNQRSMWSDHHNVSLNVAEVGSRSDTLQRSNLLASIINWELFLRREKSIILMSFIKRSVQEETIGSIQSKSNVFVPFPSSHVSTLHSKNSTKQESAERFF